MFAQDEGGTGLVGYADVQVNLKDINDNAPVFPQVCRGLRIFVSCIDGCVILNTLCIVDLIRW